jgi:hypothetical protein
MDHEAFVERVFQHLPRSKPAEFTFKSWPHGGRATDEAVGLMPIVGVDPAKVAEAVWDVDHYVGNVEFVKTCRAVPDPRFAAPGAQRFYQKIELPLLGAVHYELVMKRMPERDGYTVIAWDLLREETDRLREKEGFRSDYNQGCWLAAPGMLGYALASAPKRGDVGLIKWKAMTTGANATASRVLKANLEGMARWAARR